MPGFVKINAYPMKSTRVSLETSLESLPDLLDLAVDFVLCVFFRRLLFYVLCFF